MTQLPTWLLQAAESPAMPAGLHPIWIVAIIAVSALPAFFILHLFITTVMQGKDYEFPIKLTPHGPRFCPHCGKEIAARQPAAGQQKPAAKQPA